MSSPRPDRNVLDVLRTLKDRDVSAIDLQFVDLYGTLQHISLPASRCDVELFEGGIGFDGSSIRGFTQIHESDMVLRPEAKTFVLDPFFDDPTLSFMCDIIEPNSRALFHRDTRALAKKAERHLKRTGLADTAFFGPELEFFLFDDVRYDQTTQHGFYHVDSQHGFWNRGNGFPNPGSRPARKRGYFAAPPLDGFHNLRAKISQVLPTFDIEVEVHHAEVASGGQNEIGFKFGTLTEQADRSVRFKYVVRNVARRYDKIATFMPKPLFEENGSGMHVHVSLWKDGRNLFHEDGRYGDLSPMAEHFIAGLLAHAPALCAFCAPSTNSYRRLVPGYEAPINLVYSARNRSACIRVPNVDSPKATRIEFRTPDPTANPYLAFSAILMAGLDGVSRRLQPPAPVDVDIYELAERGEAGHIANTPADLAEALDALERDHEFLLEGGVFPKDLIEAWISTKRAQEVDFVRLRPHPAEFLLYFDA